MPATSNSYFEVGPPELWVTIGTDAGDWAPPRLVAMALGPGLVISNVHDVTWWVSAAGFVSRAALFIRGQWCELRLDAGAHVESGQEVKLAAGSITIYSTLPPISDPFANGLALPYDGHADTHRHLKGGERLMLSDAAGKQAS